MTTFETGDRNNSEKILHDLMVLSQATVRTVEGFSRLGGDEQRVMLDQLDFALDQMHATPVADKHRALRGLFVMLCNRFSELDSAAERSALPASVARRIEERVGRSAARKRERGQSPLRISMLEAIRELGANAYGTLIYDFVKDAGHRTKSGDDISFQALMQTLKSMEEKGEIVRGVGQSLMVPRRAVSVYSVTGLGEERLQRASSK